ncbi:MAG: hypothetical protein EAX95_06685 [Candidatus Thorarchaeota archaeon]|nr:hypothetical protein [Candidatus Thorarchaeota archaeon]
MFSLVLPDVIDVENLKRNESKIVRTSIALIDYLPKLQKIQDLIHGRIIKLLESTEMALSSQRSKLEERVDHLRREVENLESRLVQLKKSDSGDSSRIREIEEQKTARIVALSRDENRLKGLLSTHFESSNELQEKEVVVRQRLSTLRESLCRASDSLGAYMVSGGGLVQEVTSALLMVPFLLVGFSKRGKLSIDVYPPSYLTETPQSVSRRRDFVDAFSVVSDEVLHIADLLRERANTDVNLRKMLRTSSTTHNLLAHPQGRTFLLEGTKALVSDALARESAIDEVKALLSGFPESEITSLPRTFHYAPTSTAAEGLCSVTFHIHDESGTPVSRAVIELGVLRLRSDSKGIVRTSLPRSHYEARVAAPGLQPKNLEFTLRTLDDIVVPVVLVSLSDEERLDQELDALLERASRIEKIREKLRDAFEKQGDTLLTIPAYRAGLEDLLGELGYEPESWISEAKKKKGMVKRLLKKDDRSDGLRRDILQTAEESKQSGGIMLLSELLVRLDNQGWNVNSKEVEVILSEMSEEGLLEGTTALDSGALLVKFIPVSLTDDPQQILSLAAERDGKISIEDAVVGLSWTEERVMNALALLVEKGVAKIQKSYSKSTQYWFPGLRGKK